MNPEMSPRVFESSHGPVEYWQGGTKGPLLLGLHGAMGGYDQSALLTRTLCGPDCRTLALSRPGYLGTPMNGMESPAYQADLYAEVLEKLDIPEIIPMAVSGGGPSAIHFALRYPQKTRALVLVSTVGQKVTTPLPMAFHMMKLMARFPFMLRRMEKKASKNPLASASRSIPDEALRERTFNHPVAGPLFKELLTSTSSRMAERMTGTINDVNVTRSYDYPLEDIQCPVLVVYGTEDRFVPPKDHALHLLERIPKACGVALEGGDHVAIYTHHDHAVKGVAEFFALHHC